jgi:hypothetical protein
LTSSATGNAVCITTGKDITDAGGGTCTPSSIRFKENILELTKGSALDTLSKLKVVSFDYKEGSFSPEESPSSIGLIAEDVEKIDPRLVDYGYDGKPLTLHFERITGLTVQAIQDVSSVLGLETISTSTGKVVRSVRLDTIESRLSKLEANQVNLAANQNKGVIVKDANLLAAVGDTLKSVGAEISDTFVAIKDLFVDKLFASKFTITPDGKIIVPAGLNQMSGSAILAANAMEVFIPNTQIASTSKVFITPVNATQYPLTISEKVSGQGFKVKTFGPQANIIQFDWLIINTYQQSVDAASITTGQTPPIQTQPTIQTPPTQPVQTEPIQTQSVATTTVIITPIATTTDQTTTVTPPSSEITITPTITTSSTNGTAPDSNAAIIPPTQPQVDIASSPPS